MWENEYRRTIISPGDLLSCGPPHENSATLNVDNIEEVKRRGEELMQTDANLFKLSRAD
jgi:hypothetical protein